MRRHDDLAVVPREASAAAVSWVIEYAPSRWPSLVERGAAHGSWSAASTDTLDVLVDGTIFDAANPAQAVLDAIRQAPETAFDALAPLSGRFALFIADRSRNRLLAVRDQMGMHPLFYADAARGLLFSTSIDALLSQPEVSRDLNRVVVAEHLVHRWVDPNETYFSAVRRVPPGHALEAAGASRAVRRYWDPSSPTGGRMTDEEAVGQFAPVFERAVARCMGARRSAVFLSGGFDSVSIAATATTLARRAGRPEPHALSLGFSDPDCDEQFVQRSVAQSLGLTQELLPYDVAVGSRGVLGPALELGATWPVPILNIWAPAYYALAQRAGRHGCDTILTGTGGDEWLNVTPCLAADLMRQGRFRQLAKLTRVFQGSFRLDSAAVLKSTLWTFGLRRLIGGAADAIAPTFWRRRRHQREIEKTLPWVAPDPAIRRAMDERCERLLPPARPGPGGFYEREMRSALTHPLVAMEYEEHFEFGRRVGASMLHPYLDPDLVQLLYGMSPDALISGGRSKGLVRDTVARQFPELGFERAQKVNATGFFRGVLLREGPAAWQARNGARTLSDLGVLASSTFEPVVHDLFAGRRPNDNYLVWNVLNLESWVRARVRGTSTMGAE